MYIKTFEVMQPSPKKKKKKVIMALLYETNMAVLVPRSQAFLGQKCHFLRQIGKSKETWRQTMLFVWWAALRLSVHLLTVKERRCDTSERSVITPSIITNTTLNQLFMKWSKVAKRSLDFVSLQAESSNTQQPDTSKKK